MIKAISVLRVVATLSLMSPVQASSVDEKESNFMKRLSLLPRELHVKINALSGHGSEITDPNMAHPAAVALLQKQQFLRPRYLLPDQLIPYVSFASENGVRDVGPLVLGLDAYAIFLKQNRMKNHTQKEISSLRRALDTLDKDIGRFSSLTLVCTQVVYEGVWKELFEDLKASPSPLEYLPNVKAAVSRTKLLETIEGLKKELVENAYAIHFNPREHLNSLINSFQAYVGSHAGGQVTLEM